MKVIFLDIDGPLTMGCYGAPVIKIADFEIPYAWDKEQCEALTEIINATDAKIVITSDWKQHFTGEQFERIFEYYNIPMSIIDKTHDRKVKLSSNRVHDRSVQITDWLRDHKLDIETWVAIDDMPLHKYFRDLQFNVPVPMSTKHHFWVEGDYSIVSTKLSDHKEKIIELLNGH
jgi:hypothetical protein